jgi:hypothetical protein
MRAAARTRETERRERLALPDEIEAVRDRFVTQRPKCARARIILVRRTMRAPPPPAAAQAMVPVARLGLHQNHLLDVMRKYRAPREKRELTTIAAYSLYPPVQFRKRMTFASEPPVRSLLSEAN